WKVIVPAFLSITTKLASTSYRRAVASRATPPHQDIWVLLTYRMPPVTWARAASAAARNIPRAKAQRSRCIGYFLPRGRVEVLSSSPAPVYFTGSMGRGLPDCVRIDLMQGPHGRPANVTVLVLQRLPDRRQGCPRPGADRRQGRGGAPTDPRVWILQGRGECGDGGLGPRTQDAKHDRGQLADLGVGVSEPLGEGRHQGPV